jgi:hypothetical protein
MDVAKTPVNDLNVGRDGEIPPLLVKATAQPYTLSGLTKCRQIAGAIQQLDEVLGPDIDLPAEERDRISAGRVGKWVVASFIPFRGLIREVSGANEQQRRLQSAINAGMARRSFLKGVGLQRGCAWPARSATPEMLAQIARENEAKARAAAAADKDKR